MAAETQTAPAPTSPGPSPVYTTKAGANILITNGDNSNIKTLVENEQITIARNTKEGAGNFTFAAVRQKNAAGEMVTITINVTGKNTLESGEHQGIEFSKNGAKPVTIKLDLSAAIPIPPPSPQEAKKPTETPKPKPESNTTPGVSADYKAKIEKMHKDLGITQEMLNARGYTTLVPDAGSAVTNVGNGEKLEAKAAAKFIEMQKVAKAQGVTLEAISGYRSPDDQFKLIYDKLHHPKTPQKIEDILDVNAPPGYSQHHNNAMDILDVPGRGLNQSFAGTKAHQWLRANASKYGFKETYGNEDRTKNPNNVDFEPWHWAYHGN